MLFIINKYFIIVDINQHYEIKETKNISAAPRDLRAAW